MNTLIASYRYIPTNGSRDVRVYKSRTKFGALLKALWDLRFAWEYYELSWFEV